MCVQEELCKQILEEQRNNNLTSEILNGNAEGLSGLVGNSHALKEPGNSTQLYTTLLHTHLPTLLNSLQFTCHSYTSLQTQSCSTVKQRSEGVFAFLAQ